MTRLLSLLAVLLATVPAAVLAAPTTEISVTGTGSVTLPPTLATVSAEVQTNAPDAADAVSRNNSIYNRIVAKLQQMGIARSDIQLAFYNVSYNPKPDVMPPNPGSQQYGYTVARGFTVKVRDMARAGAVSDACTAAGATAIDGVSFGLSDPQQARAQAIARAVAQARATARVLAAAAHLKIVSIKSIQLGGGEPVRPLMMSAVRAQAPAPTQFDQGNVSVTETVGVTFSAVSQ
jgi:uncharacterized protein YggE